MSTDLTDTRNEMTEQPDTEAPSVDVAEQVIATVETSDRRESDADQNTASPWPMRASPYI
jgi:hypothetical protein